MTTPDARIAILEQAATQHDANATSFEESAQVARGKAADLRAVVAVIRAKREPAAIGEMQPNPDTAGESP